MSNIPENILELIIAFYLDEISENEKVTLENWVYSSSEHEEYFKQILSICHNLYLTFHEKEVDEVYEKMLQNINQYVKSKKHKLFIHYFTSSVAIVLLFIGVGIIYNKMTNNDKQDVVVADLLDSKSGERIAILKTISGEQIILGRADTTRIEIGDGVMFLQDTVRCDSKYQTDKLDVQDKYTTIQIPQGGEYSLTLSDGTNIWLNSESELKFPASFKKSRREVYLKGEAFFEVTENKDSPFIIKMPEADVKVLGTSFNVMNYDNEKKVEVALERGSVIFYSNNTNQKCRLYPGQVVRLNKEDSKMVTSYENIEQITAWKSGLFYFENMPLEELVLKLERWYQVKFEFENEELRAMCFTGAVKKYNTLSFILELITKTQDVVFVESENQILVRKR